MIDLKIDKQALVGFKVPKYENDKMVGYEYKANIIHGDIGLLDNELGNVFSTRYNFQDLYNKLQIENSGGNFTYKNNVLKPMSSNKKLKNSISVNNWKTITASNFEEQGLGFHAIYDVDCKNGKVIVKTLQHPKGVDLDSFFLPRDSMDVLTNEYRLNKVNFISTNGKTKEELEIDTLKFKNENFSKTAHNALDKLIHAINDRREKSYIRRIESEKADLEDDRWLAEEFNPLTIFAK